MIINTHWNNYQEVTVPKLLRMYIDNRAEQPRVHYIPTRLRSTVRGTAFMPGKSTSNKQGSALIQRFPKFPKSIFGNTNQINFSAADVFGIYMVEGMYGSNVRASANYGFPDYGTMSYAGNFAYQSCADTNYSSGSWTINYNCKASFLNPKDWHTGSFYISIYNAPNLVSFVHYWYTGSYYNTLNDFNIYDCPNIRTVYLGGWRANGGIIASNCFRNCPKIERVVMNSGSAGSLGPYFLRAAFDNLFANNDYVELYYASSRTNLINRLGSDVTELPFWNTRVHCYGDPGWVLPAEAENPMLPDKRNKLFFNYPSLKIQGTVAERNKLVRYLNGYYDNGDGSGMLDEEYLGMEGVKELRPYAFSITRSAQSYYDSYPADPIRYVDLPNIERLNESSLPPYCFSFNLPNLTNIGDGTKQYCIPSCTSAGSTTINQYLVFCNFQNLEYKQMNDSTNYFTDVYKLDSTVGSAAPGGCVIDLKNYKIQESIPLDYIQQTRTVWYPTRNIRYFRSLYLDSAIDLTGMQIYSQIAGSKIYLGPDFYPNANDKSYKPTSTFSSSNVADVYLDLPRAEAELLPGFDTKFCTSATANYRIICNDDPDWKSATQLRHEDRDYLIENGVPEWTLDRDGWGVL